MSGELNLKNSATGKTILALILAQDRSCRWNGSELAPFNSVADANWTTGMITLVEQTTQNSTPTATYIGDFPAAIASPGEYVVEYYLSTAAAPGSAAIGVQTIWWNGTQMISPAEVLPVDLVKIMGNDVNHDVNGGLLPPFFESLLARTGSTRTVIAVKGSSPFATWAENVLKGCMIYYRETSGVNPRFFPAVILSNTAVNSSSGTITLAGEGFPAAPQLNNQLALMVHTQAAVLDVKAKTDAIPSTIDGKTLEQALQIIAAVLAGKVSGAGTGTETFRGLDDGHDRVVVTADACGNRTNVTYP